MRDPRLVGKADLKVDIPTAEFRKKDSVKSAVPDVFKGSVLPVTGSIIKAVSRKWKVMSERILPPVEEWSSP